MDIKKKVSLNIIQQNKMHKKKRHTDSGGQEQFFAKALKCKMVISNISGLFPNV